MSQNGALRIFRQMCDGLHAIHRLGIVHRDIKPGNVMLTSDLQHCQLLDFGLADDHSNSSQSESGSLSGTRGYLPPERLKGFPGDYRSDFFSLGCVAYEMFAGRLLHQLSHYKSENRLYLKVIDETDQWKSTPVALRTMILGMIEPDPEARTCDYSVIMNTIQQFHTRFILLGSFHRF